MPLLGAQCIYSRVGSSWLPKSSHSILVISHGLSALSWLWTQLHCDLKSFVTWLWIDLLHGLAWVSFFPDFTQTFLLTLNPDSYLPSTLPWTQWSESIHLNFAWVTVFTLVTDHIWYFWAPNQKVKWSVHSSENLDEQISCFTFLKESTEVLTLDTLILTNFTLLSLSGILATYF